MRIFLAHATHLSSVAHPALTHLAAVGSQSMHYLATFRAPEVSVAIAALGLLAVWANRRDAQLRRDDVLGWSNEAIVVLESLLLICKFGDTFYTADELAGKLKELSFRSAILVEQGRLFFRNKKDGSGLEKEPAYQGLRPCVLDPLVVAHQIASGWLTADAPTRGYMQILAQSYLKKFVSLVQQEVGRSRTASPSTSHGGDSIRIGALIAEIRKKALTSAPPSA